MSQIVQSGNYTLELDTGFDVGSFRLDDTTKGVLNNTEYLLGPTTQFADITDFTTQIIYRRGRRKPDDQPSAGTLTFVMRDETGILGPYDTTSPYYDPANNEPGLAPMRAMRLKRGTESLFVGTVISYQYDFAKAGPNTVIVQCIDDLYKIAQTNLQQLNVTPETSGQRINTILALPEVDYTGTTNIDPGTVNLGHDAAYTIPAGTNTLGYLQQINQAEQGRLFIDRTGSLVFQPRIGTTLSAPVVSFKDDGTAYDYDTLNIEFDAENVVNYAYIRALDGDEAVDEDLASQAKYFIQAKQITNSLLHDQSEIDALAAYLLEPEPAPRFTDVGVYYRQLTNPQRDAVTTIDIGDTISIEKDIPGLNSQIAQELAVEGIEARITFNDGHYVTFYTSPTTIVYELILDDPTYAVIDAANVLG